MSGEDKVHSIQIAKKSALRDAFIELLKPYKFVAWFLWGTVVVLSLLNAVFTYYILSDLKLSELQAVPEAAPKSFAVLFAFMAGGVSLIVRNIFLSKKVFDRVDTADRGVDSRSLSEFEFKFLKMIPRWNIVNFSTWLLNASICVIGMFFSMMYANIGLMVPFLVVSLVFNFVMRPDWNTLVEKWK